MSEFVEMQSALLGGSPLDYAVAKAEGFELRRLKHDFRLSLNGADAGFLRKKSQGFKVNRPGYWQPSLDWNQGGPLIDKHRISFVTNGTGPSDEQGNEPIVAIAGGLNWKACEGKTHLIAACRAVVAAKLGDTVSVPKELLP
jgi:hypothetical protein